MSMDPTNRKMNSHKHNNSVMMSDNRKFNDENVNFIY